jgi:tetratricopeptide (TPR) repeat protein
VAQQAALLLVRKNKHADAVGLLEQAAQRSQDSPDLLLTQAVVAGLMDRVTDSEKMLQRIESRWPEWDRPYLVHGLLLERGQSAEARQRFQTALALGSQDLAARCALARVEQKAPPDPKCDCVKGLYEFLFPACEKTQEAGSYKR